MPDIIIKFDNETNIEEMADLLKSRYPLPKPKIAKHQMPWGNIVLVKNHFKGYESYSSQEGELFLVIGRPLINSEKVDRSLSIEFAGNQQPGNHYSRRLYSLYKRLNLNNWTDILNGEFAIILVNRTCPQIAVVTDPMNTIPVYVGRNQRGELKALGTHADLVAELSGSKDALDLISIAEFMIESKITFPYTYYRGVKELPPASYCKFSVTRVERDATEITQYWRPTSYEGNPKKIEEWAEMLRSALRKGVKECIENNNRIGILLSGGLDSRAVLAVIPNGKERTAFTVCDKPNTHTEIARRVAAQAKAKWVLLQRDNEYYGNLAVNATKLSGGEATFLDAHFLSFRDRICDEGIDIILGGYNADTLFKGFYCSESLRIFGKELPIKKCRGNKDAETLATYLESGSNGVADSIKQEIIEEVLHRRNIYYEYMKTIRKDGSEWEWFYVWPESRKTDIQNISAHRRILPKSEVFSDRRIIEIASQIPQGLKINSKVYRLAILPILGKLSRIPVSDSGIPLWVPLPLQYSFLITKKIAQKAMKTLNLLNYEAETLVTNGSWPNREWYWRNSRVLEGFRREFIEKPPPFWNELFKGKLEEIFTSPISTFEKYRILQVCIWDRVRRGEI